MLALLCLASAVRADDAAKGLRVGFASVDVTPDVAKSPVYLAGFGKNRRATKVHDPLYVRTIVLADGAKTIAFSSVDVIGLFHDVTENVRPRLPDLAYLVVSSTHSHHGPDTVGMWGPSLFQTGADPAYLKRIEDAVVASVGQARSKMHEVAEVRVGTARDGDLLHDSRKPIVKHDEIVVLRFSDADKKVLGTLVQWNCHPEAIQRNNTEVSADYVPATVAYLEKKSAAPVVYLSGTVGGLMSPIHVKKNDETGEELTDGSFPMCERYGVLVGRLAEKALADGKVRPLTPFVVRSREFYLPIDNAGYMLGYRLGVLKRAAYRWTGDVDKAGHAGSEGRQGPPLLQDRGRPAHARRRRRRLHPRRDLSGAGARQGRRPRGTGGRLSERSDRAEHLRPARSAGEDDDRPGERRDRLHPAETAMGRGAAVLLRPQDAALRRDQQPGPGDGAAVCARRSESWPRRNDLRRWGKRRKSEGRPLAATSPSFLSTLSAIADLSDPASTAGIPESTAPAGTGDCCICGTGTMRGGPWFGAGGGAAGM